MKYKHRQIKESILKLISTVLFSVAVFSFPLSFIAAALAGEFAIFGMMGMIRYSWVAWVCILFNIGTILYAVFVCKRARLKYKALIVIAIVPIPFMLGMGAMRFMFLDYVSYNDAPLVAMEQRTGLDFPTPEKIITDYIEQYPTGYAKLRPSEVGKFTKALDEDDRWVKAENYRLSVFLSSDMQDKLYGCTYFLLYNATDGTFNTYPKEKGTYRFTLAAYDSANNRLVIVYDFDMIIRG